MALVKEYDDVLLDGIVKICNNKEFRKRVHPNVCKHLRFDRWMVEVCIEAQYALKEEWENEIPDRQLIKTCPVDGESAIVGLRK